MKRIVCMMAVACMSFTAFAQQDTTTWKRFTLDSGAQESAKTYIPVTQYWKEHNIFQHLDISLTAGTTGIGIDVASPVGKYVQLRAGYEFMPRFTKRMKFDLTINGEPAIVYDEQPVGFKQSWSQRTRWTVGHIQCLKEYTGDLAMAFKDNKTVMNFDGLLYMLGSIPMYILTIVL